MLAGLCLCLLAGCASSPTQSRKVYDRYAELVAARTRATEAPAAKASEAADKRSSKAGAKPPATPRPAASGPKPAPTAPVARMKPAADSAPVAEPVPAPENLPVPVPPVAPEPVPPPPVQVIAARPAEPPVPVPPASVQPAPEAAANPAAAPAAEAPVPAPPPVAPDAAAIPAAASSTDGVAYLLKVGDVIQIFLRGIPSGDAIEDVIDENGNVSLPLINEVRAAGMTAAELERNIRKIYLDLDIYRNIAVTVVVPTRYYFIQGEIRGPGRFQIVSATRVSQAIAAAGGYTEYASGQVVVKRGGKIVKTIRNAKRLERTPDDDVLLEPDDIIEVRRSLW
jgi:protein involved in polysaccharide export with SLBB domain